ncbi:hypothetical protein FQK07_10100 [Synechococcus sp. BSF8S]|uniref:hypothetical protein n=1 Tax=Synechococcales TaxID=1890424 RepID=UPI001623A2CA|nr:MULTISPECIES: hypothetical protein [unclassified Synechococcus]MBC1261607.1 hypothetical protein [Synechococcus sp. BSF8S]MBC1264536.1 hypothetical protein [Synechococcus sp. BSA11S]
MRRPAFLLASALLLGTSGLGLSVEAKESRPNIEVASMMRYCQGEVAAKYRVSPHDISTLPVERQGNSYRVYGQTPAEGSEALFFYCEFNQHREFDGVKMTSDKRPSGDSGGSAKERVKVEDMARYCTGMAAEKFKQSPRYITSNEPSRQSNGTYKVYGQYDASSTNTQAFVCTYNANVVFKSVVKN